MQAEIIKIHNYISRGATISTDSRQTTNGAVFFALKGENFDANTFAAQALENGAAIAVVDNKQLEANDRFIVVDDVLQSLQELALYHRRQFSIPVLGITGSNGKTTTKELINAVLSRKYNTLCTQGNLNNHIGVPLTLLNMNPQHEVAIIEMGANHVGEIEMLCQLARPTLGLITNIGKAHIEGFGSFENIIKGKTELYTFIKDNEGVIFLNDDNNILKQHAGNHSRITYGSQPQSNYQGTILSASPFLELSFSDNQTATPIKETLKIRSQLFGAYNFENIMSALAVGLHMGVSPQEAISAIEAYAPRNSRSQLKYTDNNTLILDAYNANPTSMKAALQNFNQIATTQPKALLLGDMLELGPSSAGEHEEIVQQIRKHSYAFVGLVGEQFMHTTASRNGFHVFLNVKMAADWLAQNQPQNMFILLKASRGTGLEKLEPFL